VEEVARGKAGGVVHIEGHRLKVPSNLDVHTGHRGNEDHSGRVDGIAVQLGNSMQIGERIEVVVNLVENRQLAGE
jgi:hypothetical protein